MSDACEICGLTETFHNESYHNAVVWWVRNIQDGYYPAMLTWTGLSSESPDLRGVNYASGGILIDESILENRWRKKRISFAQWKSLMDRIKNGEPLWMVANQDTLAGAYLRHITNLYPRTGSIESIDLKWSLWTTDFSVWMDYAPEFYDTMRIILDTSGSFEVRTAPRKEVRFGYVKFQRKGNRYTATVDFVTIWDDIEVLAENYISEDSDPDNIINYAWEIAPATINGTGVAVNRKVSSKTFAGLMKKIDEAEDELMSEDEAEWKLFDGRMRNYAE